VRKRALELAATSGRPETAGHPTIAAGTEGKRVRFPLLIGGSRTGQALRTAVITVRAPEDIGESTIEALPPRAVPGGPAMARELDDAILHLRTNHAEAAYGS